jgi:hypothetical protein
MLIAPFNWDLMSLNKYCEAVESGLTHQFMLGSSFWMLLLGDTIIACGLPVLPHAGTSKIRRCAMADPFWAVS